MKGWQRKLCSLFRQYIKETRGVDADALQDEFETREKVIAMTFQSIQLHQYLQYSLYVRKELIPYINEDTVKGIIFQEKKEKFFDFFVEYFVVFKDGMFVLGDL